MEFDLKNVKEFDPNTIYLRDGQFLEHYKGGNVDLTDGLPNGILDKRYTGIGATTVEFNSKRKSIIVFPFRKIALEKFKKYASKKNVFYVGTDEQNNSKSIDDIAFFVEENYDKHIKFCVVADSINKVIEGIKKAGFDPYKDYFLVLDEVEILQLQSAFRKRLPLCFEYFKEFKRKCLVSATIIDFSDEKLNKLPMYHVEKSEYSEEEGDILYFDNLNLRKYSTNFPHIEVAKDIVEFYKKDPANSNYKFFIGLNSKQAITEFIEEVEKENKSISISVIASVNTPDSFLIKYTKHEILEEKLPSKINLSTCIGWSGIDIKDSFFSIAISLNTEVHHSFSFENLIQFFGRCRFPKNNQLSKTFVVGKNPKLEYKRSDGRFKDRVSDIENLLIHVDKNIKSKSDKKAILSSLLKSKTNLIYKNRENKPQANWLLKDLEAYTEKVVEDYNSLEDGILKRLEERYTIQEIKTLIREIDLPTKSSQEKLEQKLEILISNLSKDYNDNDLINHIRKTKIPTLRLAAYWFLFGRKILKNQQDPIKLAKYFSGYSKDINSNHLLPITKITLDSLYFCQFESELWDDLVQELKVISKGGKKKKAKDFLFVFHKTGFKEYLPSVQSSTSVGYFFKFVLGINSEGKTGGSDTFLVEENKTYLPKLYKDYPILKKSLSQIPKFLKGKEGISFGKTSIQNILQEQFKIET